MEYETLNAAKQQADKENQFPMILEKTLSYEGEALNAQERSKYGVTEPVYFTYLKEQGKPQQPIEKIRMPEVQDIYHSKYFLANNLDKLPVRTSAVVFDYAVQSGNRGVKALQKAVGTVPDGKIGPKTLAALSAYIAENGEDALLDAIMTERREFIEGFIKRNNREDAEGLRNRLTRVELDWVRKNNGIRNLKK